MKNKRFYHSSVRIIALSLVIVMLAGIMSSCSITEAIGESVEKFKIDLPEITVKTKEELAANGITADDVLARYDLMAKKVAFVFAEESDYITEDTVNAQFTSITVSDRYINKAYSWTQDPYYMREKWLYPQVADAAAEKAEDKSAFSPYITANEEEIISKDSSINIDEFKAYIAHTYKVKFNYISESYGIGSNNTIDSWGIFYSQFERALEALEADTVELTEDLIPTKGRTERGKEIDIYSEYSIESYDFQLGLEVYEPITIDRELIKGATEHQLWALYNMVEHMELINLQGKLPDGCSDITFEGTDLYGNTTVERYSCYKIPKVYKGLYSSGDLKYQYELEYNANGQLTSLKYFENTLSVFKYLYRQSFSEDGKLTGAIYTIAYDGFEKYFYDNVEYKETPYSISILDNIAAPESFFKMERWLNDTTMEYYVEREYYSENSYNDKVYNPNGTIRY